MEFASTYLHQEGVGLQDVGRHLEAIAKFDESIKAIPSRETYCARAKSLIELARFDEALADLEAAIALDPDYVFAYWGRGIVKRESGEFDGALQDFARAISLDPEMPGVYAARGWLHCFSLGNSEEAVEDYTIAIELEPENWSHYAHRGLAHFLNGDYESAVNDNTAALARMTLETDTTDRARVHFARHKSYEFLGKSEKSQADFRRARELDASVLR
jgi:tetratricopeptide (TPR) repeat protein